MGGRLLKRLLVVTVSCGVFFFDRSTRVVLRLIGRHSRGTCVVLQYHSIPAEQRTRFAKQMDILRRIAVPTLVLWGGSDRIVRPDYGRAFQRAIPGAQFQTIPEAGHYPYLERPDQFVAMVTEFLS